MSDIVAQVIMYGVFFFLLYKIGVEFKLAVKENPTISSSAPQVFSSLGVLGTFVGITYSLITFDPNHLESSVPTLLSGMKLAFVTSIIGMAGSLVMKRYQKSEIAKSNVKIIEGVTLDDILKNLLENDVYKRQRDQEYFELIRANNEILKSTIQGSLEKMTKSLVGDGEATLIGQIKFLRSDFNDKQQELMTTISEGNNELIDKFTKFADNMAENNNKAFIQALNESMKDLNNQLQEQFGENFKELNIAVGRMLDWQENYKKVIEQVTDNRRTHFQ